MLTQKKNETCPFKDLVQEWDEDDGYIMPSYVRAARTAMNVARRHKMEQYHEENKERNEECEEDE